MGFPLPRRDAPSCLPPLAGEEIKWSLGGRERDNPATSSD